MALTALSKVSAAQSQPCSGFKDSLSSVSKLSPLSGLIVDNIADDKIVWWGRRHGDYGEFPGLKGPQEVREIMLEQFKDGIHP